MATTFHSKQPRLRVWYCYTKLNKIAKKREFAVLFENSWSVNSETWVNSRMIVAAMRYQTEMEAEDGKLSNRQFTKYSMFIDEKPYYSEICRVLEFNSKAEHKNVDPETLEKISLLCAKKFKEYNRMFPAPEQIKRKRKNTSQLELDFN